LGQKKGISSIFLYDEELRKNYPLIAGLDEAGRGSLAGPLVAAAVILPGKLAIDGLRDSKKVLEDERERLFWDVLCRSLDIGVGIVESDVIDSTNILRATKLAMEMAIKDLNRKPDILLIDAVRLEGVSIPQKSIIKGESVSASIAAASIIAKVVRDRLMRAYHEKYPFYNFMEHKGYSTRQHIECLRLHGPCPIHRKSFRKVMDMELPFAVNVY